MNSLIETFHIDATLILAQIINFLVVLAVLYYFAIKPLIKNMSERNNEIERGLKDAKKSEESLLRAKEEYQKMIKEARIEAGVIIEEAVNKGELKKQQAVKDAEESIENIIKKEKSILLKEREQIIEDIKEKTSDIVILAVEKIIKKELDERNNEAIIKDAFNKLDIYKKAVSSK
jgi:F-type H+-transporting ATPase subunit b